MAYFLKKSKLKKGLYLQIYESFYNPQKGQTAHRSYKAIGYENELKEKGIEDPIAYYQQEVDRLNTERKSRRTQEKKKQIGEETPEKYLGYFPLKSINDQLGVKKYMDLMQTATDSRTTPSISSAPTPTRMHAPSRLTSLTPFSQRLSKKSRSSSGRATRHRCQPTSNGSMAS